MTENEARGYIQGKLNCMNKCNVFEREHSKKTDLCDNCEYCYSQGTFGQQKEAFEVAIKALEKQEKMTNADRIRAMSNWELAEFLYSVSNGATKISTCEEECANCEYSDGYCTYKIGEWLISEQ